MNLFTLFVILNVVNVIIQTVKSLCTVKCGKWLASIVNALAYGLYTVVIIYMNCDLALWQKVAVVACSNLIGVFTVKLIEEKLAKDKLWKIEFTIHKQFQQEIENILKFKNIPYSYNQYGKHTMFNVYCQTQKQSSDIAEIVRQYNGKYFVTENRGILY